MGIKKVDGTVIHFFKRTYLPLGRVALFVVFFGFGILKLLDLSPASELAEALVSKTVGMNYFNLLFKGLALIECIIGILFLLPKTVRLAIPLLLFHLAVVSAPLMLVPELVWQQPFVPTLEGQYIIKNIALVAVAFGIAAHTDPLTNKSTKKSH